MADAVINDECDEAEGTYKIFLWKRVDNYSGHKKLFSVDNCLTNEAENIRNALH